MTPTVNDISARSISLLLLTSGEGELRRVGIRYPRSGVGDVMVNISCL